MSDFTRMIRKALAAVTAFVLLLGSAGLEAFADEGDAPPAVQETVETGEGSLQPPPAEPEITQEPEVPAEPENPVVPEVPAEPEVTDEPEIPAEPEIPMEPEVPAEPEVPTEPEIPMEPEVPAEPEVTVEPEIPVEPEAPVETEIPAEPEVTVEPEIPAEPEATAEPEEELVSEDPLYWKYGGGPMVIRTIPEDYSKVHPRALRKNETLRKGVDVSEFQVTNKSSYNINWKKAAQAGIEFAIVRVGYRGTREGALAKDAFYDQNIRGAQAAGVKVGAYIFSQAVTTEEAREEARYLVSIVKNYKIDLPLVFDYEEVTANSRRLKMAELDRQLKTDICNAFCDEVEKAGYQSMVYTNLSMLQTDLYREQLGRVWLAHWIAQTSYTGSYEYWQFGVGTVSGIPSEVDLDYWYDPSGTPPSGGTQTLPELPDPETVPEPGATAAPDATPKPSPTPAAYTDVSKDDWFYDDVRWASDKNVASGVGNGKFEPQSSASRGQVVTMIHRLKGEPQAKTDAGFTDLRQDYYKAAVNWAFDAGVVNGTGDSTFSPDGRITREDLVTMLYRMMGSPAEESDLSAFADMGSIHSYALHSMAWAVKVGLIRGYTDNTIRPGASATRAEVCAILRRYAQLAS